MKPTLVMMNMLKPDLERSLSSSDSVSTLTFSTIFKDFVGHSGIYLKLAHFPVKVVDPVLYCVWVESF